MEKYENDIDRIKVVYERRKEHSFPGLYSFFNPANMFIIQQRDSEIIHALKKHRITSLGDKKILDIGCGTGDELRNLIRYGARPKNLWGIDLLQSRIDQAKTITPNIDFQCGDASKLPYEDENFDIIMQFTVFTSILDPRLKKSIAVEMIRVLKKNGLIIWYDFHMNNPRNPDVRGIRKSDIFDFFPNCSIHLKRITLAPPLARLLAPYSLFSCYILEKLKVFNTHYIGIIEKES